MIRIGAPVTRHLPAILKGLEDTSPLVRYKSAHCLEPLGTVAAPGVLKLGSLLTDPDEKVRHYSARALARLDEVARPALPALKAAREKETVAASKGLMDSAIRRLSP
jgi:HEAT repeat protein